MLDLNMNNTEITLINPLQLKPHPSNAKKHPKKQVEAIADSIKRYGFNIPVVVRNGYILAGHGRVEASKLLRLNVVPCIVLDHLTDEEARAFIIADNRTSELGEWDRDKLYDELKSLHECEVPTIDMDLMQLGALCGDLDFGELRAEFPADRDDRLGEYVEPDEDFSSDFEDEEESEEDDATTSETTAQKKEPINFTFMVILNKQQHKRLLELKNGLSDKQFFLQNVLGESDEH